MKPLRNYSLLFFCLLSSSVYADYLPHHTGILEAKGGDEVCFAAILPLNRIATATKCALLNKPQDITLLTTTQAFPILCTKNRVYDSKCNIYSVTFPEIDPTLPITVGFVQPNTLTKQLPSEVFSWHPITEGTPAYKKTYFQPNQFAQGTSAFFTDTLTSTRESFTVHGLNPLEKKSLPMAETRNDPVTWHVAFNPPIPSEQDILLGAPVYGIHIDPLSKTPSSAKLDGIITNYPTPDNPNDWEVTSIRYTQKLISMFSSGDLSKTEAAVHLAMSTFQPDSATCGTGSFIWPHINAMDDAYEHARTQTDSSVTTVRLVFHNGGRFSHTDGRFATPKKTVVFDTRFISDPISLKAEELSIQAVNAQQYVRGDIPTSLFRPKPDPAKKCSHSSAADAAPGMEEDATNDRAAGDGRVPRRNPTDEQVLDVELQEALLRSQEPTMAAMYEDLAARRMDVPGPVRAYYFNSREHIQRYINAVMTDPARVEELYRNPLALREFFLNTIDHNYTYFTAITQAVEIINPRIRVIGEPVTYCPVSVEHIVRLIYLVNGMRQADVLILYPLVANIAGVPPHPIGITLDNENTRIPFRLRELLSRPGDDPSQDTVTGLDYLVRTLPTLHDQFRAELLDLPTRNVPVTRVVLAILLDQLLNTHGHVHLSTRIDPTGREPFYSKFTRLPGDSSLEPRTAELTRMDGDFFDEMRGVIAANTETDPVNVLPLILGEIYNNIHRQHTELIHDNFDSQRDNRVLTYVLYIPSIDVEYNGELAVIFRVDDDAWGVDPRYRVYFADGTPHYLGYNMYRSILYRRMGATRFIGGPGFTGIPNGNQIVNRRPGEVVGVPRLGDRRNEVLPDVPHHITTLINEYVGAIILVEILRSTTLDG